MQHSSSLCAALAPREGSAKCNATSLQCWESTGKHSGRACNHRATQFKVKWLWNDTKTVTCHLYFRVGAGNSSWGCSPEQSKAKQSTAGCVSCFDFLTTTSPSEPNFQSTQAITGSVLVFFSPQSEVFTCKRTQEGDPSQQPESHLWYSVISVRWLWGAFISFYN